MGAGYYIVYFLKGSSSLSISLKDFSVKEKVASGVLAIGIPATPVACRFNMNMNKYRRCRYVCCAEP